MRIHQIFCVRSAAWLVVAMLFLWPSWAEAKEVVIYTSLDQVFSEPVLKEFEKESGITVKMVFDTEAAKTTGLVNRLIAEKDRPVCDVFWNSETARTIVLKEKGVLALYKSPSAEDIPQRFKDRDSFWTGFAARARVLVYHTGMLQASELPKSIFELTEPRWSGKFAMAYPLFGTTATHMAVLYAVLGKEKAEQFLRDLKANQVVIVKGNATAREMVVEGELPIAFTDTDDVHVARKAGKPVQMIFPDAGGIGTLLIPNTVALIRDAPHSEEAKQLIDYLLSRKVEQALAFAESAQIPVRSGVGRPSHVPDIDSLTLLEIDYAEAAQYLDEVAKLSQELFLR